jgi:cytochrome c-type biogenesis protein CcmE
MSDVDDELRKALAESEQQSPPVADAPAVSVSSANAPFGSGESQPSRNLGLLIGLLVAAGAILALVFTSVDDAAIYSVSASALLETPEKYEGKNVRVAGNLVVGTLRRRDQPCEYRFSIQKDGKQLDVHYPRCVVPDTLKDAPDVQVTAEGSLTEDGHFEATHVMAKCPSKYEMQERAKSGEAAPHAMQPSAMSGALGGDVPAGTMPATGTMPAAGAATPSAASSASTSALADAPTEK